MELRLILRDHNYMDFKLVSTFKPNGDQPKAIQKLTGYIRKQRTSNFTWRYKSGKTFTMANIIEKCNRPTLIIAHNKAKPLVS